MFKQLEDAVLKDRKFTCYGYSLGQDMTFCRKLLNTASGRGASEKLFLARGLVTTHEVPLHQDGMEQVEIKITTS